VQGVIPDACDSDPTPVVQVWEHGGVVGTYGWHANDRCRSAEHGIAADRFAREIVGFLKVVGGALAATECQTVRRIIDAHINFNRVDL
jgi:hypothetical protein